MKPKVIVVDIDGVLIDNKFLKIFRNSHYRIEKTTFLKNYVLRFSEVIERKTRIKHTPNQKLIKLLNSLKAKANTSSIFILTDRSFNGLENIFFESISLLRLDCQDCIQIRDKKRRKKIKSKAKIIFNPSIKPHKSVLFPLISFIKSRGIKESEVLVLDDNSYFLEVARKLGFKVFLPQF